MRDNLEGQLEATDKGAAILLHKLSIIEPQQLGNL